MAKKLIKEARIVKRKGKYCVIGHKKDKSGNYRSFGCYDTKDEAKKRLGQIYAFKHRKGEIISVLHKVSGVLYDSGQIHIADAITGCINSVIQEESRDNTAIKLGKIVTLLQKRNADLAERLESLLPEILTLEETGCEEEIPTRHRISAQRAYNITCLLKKKYLEGEIDEGDFEYAKMQELESLLKTGFIFPMPKSYEKLPTDADSWWDHFKKDGENNAF